MSKNNSVNKDSNNKVKVIHKQNMSSFIFLKPGILSICLFLYAIFNFDFVNSLILIFVSFVLLIQPYIHWNEKKFLITENKVYFYKKNQKILSWSYLEDFKYIDYKQDKFGILFNYGTLILVSQDDTIYLFEYLTNPKDVFFKLSNTIENHLKKFDPSFKLIKLIEIDKENKENKENKEKDINEKN